MDNLFNLGNIIAEDVLNEQGICFYPGRFKPPHKGHYRVAKELASPTRSYITKVIVLISLKDIEGISARESYDTWKTFLKASPNPKIQVMLSEFDSPIVDIISYLDSNPNEKAVYVVAGADESDDTNYVQALQENYGDKVMGITMDETEGIVTSPYVRDLLEQGDYEGFKKCMPEVVNNKGFTPDLFKMLSSTTPKEKEQIQEETSYGLQEPQYLLSKLTETIEYLKGKNKVLLLSTSNRGPYIEENNGEIAKSLILAHIVKEALGDKAVLFDVAKMNIVVCEGNVSMKTGNACGLKKAALEDPEKNPTGNHRCWANLNFPEDELWKISKELFNSDAVIFFGSNRWGVPNSIYQKLIERLNWIENRHTTLGEDNLVAAIESGMIWLGHNWNMVNTLELQKQVHQFYGFNVNEALYWGWQYTEDAEDESKEGYRKDFPEFRAQLGQ
jgi:nicotinamide mononucleotide adenylyltransferase/multimeric flavodoxin WrbA